MITQELLILILSALSIGIIVLAFQLSQAKKKNAENSKTLLEQDKKILEIQEEHIKSKRNIETRLSDSVNELRAENNKSKRDLSTTFDKQMSQNIDKLHSEQKRDKRELTEAFNKAISENVNKINTEYEKGKQELTSVFNGRILSVVKELQDEYNTDKYILTETFNEQIVGSISELQDYYNAKISTLASALEKLSIENAELKKKLEFFTEIEADSKNLNESEDEIEREKLIEQAIAELKNLPEKKISKVAPSKKIESQEKDSNNLKAKIEKHLIEPEKATSKGRKEQNSKLDFVSIPIQEENIAKKKEEPSRKQEEPRKVADAPSTKVATVLEKEPVIAKATEKIETEVLSTKAESILDEEQAMAFSIMNNTNDNLFITGKAGTGKSFLLDVFVRTTSKKTIKLAPTGIAALNIKGVTIHSAFGYHNLEQLEHENITAENLLLKSEKKHILREIDTIIIDEISMVRADVFDKIDKILRIINKSAKPFGGKQMIVFGDLFQLPPIAKSQEIKYLTDYYGGIFFFNSNAYSNGQFGFIELTINHRQKEDISFFEVLNRMREGRLTNDDVEKLNSRKVENPSMLRRILTLFPNKADAERVNQDELEKIEAKEYKWKAEIVYNARPDQTPNLESLFPISSILRLKRGALVMLVSNDSSRRWVNGTMGVVKSLDENSIHITIDGTTFEVKKEIFSQKEAIYKDGHITYKTILQVEQFPVVLAYAITIHKSQGMTYKKIACDISRCFAPGQAYVALSRCSSLGGLHLLKLVNTHMMDVEDNVKNFYLSQSTEKTLQKYR